MLNHVGNAQILSKPLGYYHGFKTSNTQVGFPGAQFPCCVNCHKN